VVVRLHTNEDGGSDENCGKRAETRRPGLIVLGTLVTQRR
jgi:hypothetical protein